MIRPGNIFWVGLAFTLGYGLYHLKHEVKALEDELFRLNRQILAEQQAIHVLRAEWSYINQPQRLQSLTQRHLDLQPTKPAQIGTLAALPARPAEAPAPAIADSSPAVPAPEATGLKSRVTSSTPAKPASGKTSAPQKPAVLASHGRETPGAR
jgi:hypothetical protein